MAGGLALAVVVIAAFVNARETANGHVDLRGRGRRVRVDDSAQCLGHLFGIHLFGRPIEDVADRLCPRECPLVVEVVGDQAVAPNPRET